MIMLDVAYVFVIHKSIYIGKCNNLDCSYYLCIYLLEKYKSKN